MNERQVKKLMVMAALALAITAFAGAQVSRAADTISLRVTDFYPEKHPISQGFLKYFAKALEEKTQGRVKIDYFGQETLVKANDMFDATVAGTADIGNMVYAGSKVPLMYFQQLPGVYSDEDSVKAARAFWKVSKKYVDPEFEKKGLKLLYGFTTSNYQVITAAKAVRTVDDLAGLKIRATGAVLPNSVKALDAVPVSISTGEAYEAMERRVIEGIALAVPSVKSYSFYELIKYATVNANLGGYPIYYAINLNTWNKLPDDIKGIIEGMSDEVTEQTTEFYVDQVKSDLADWKAKGIELINMPDEETHKAARKLAPVWAKWVESMMERGHPMQDLIKDWKTALAEDELSLNDELLSQLPWNN